LSPMETSPAKRPIKDWAEDDRPREKLLRKGPRSLSDAELIAILIGSGNLTESAVEVAKNLLHAHSNKLHQLSKASLKDLMQFKGIGEAKAVSILAAMEIGRRRKDNPFERTSRVTSKDIFQEFAPLLADHTHEELWIVMLNRASRLIGKKNVSIGGVSATIVDPKIIFKVAIENLASSIVLVHNHPSGSCVPSKEDFTMTRKMVDCGKVLGIPIVDHVIVVESGYYSFAEEGHIVQ